VTLVSVFLALAAAFLISQVASVWPTVATMAAARDLRKARASENRKETEAAARSLIRRRPENGELHLLLSRTILDGGDPKKAGSAYAAAAKRSLTSRHRAAVQVGMGAALLRRRSPPSKKDLAAAIKSFKKGAEVSAASGDAQALLAVAHIWAGDLDAARAAADAATAAETSKGRKAGLGIQPSAALACAKAYLAGASGDAATSLQELHRARMLVPRDDTAIGKYVSEMMKNIELEAAVRPEAAPALKAKLVKHLQTEGPKGIADEDSFPRFFRAAFSCALSKSTNVRKIGMDILKRAVVGRPADPAPHVAIAAALAHGAEPLWEEAEKAHKSAMAAAARRGEKEDGLSVADILPGGGGRKRTNGSASKSLKRLDAVGLQIDDALAKAAALCAAAGNAEDMVQAAALYEYLFRWYLRSSELSTHGTARSIRELKAASLVTAMSGLLGERIPRTAVAARLLRNAGAIYAKSCAWEKAGACFAKSLELSADQPTLKPYMDSIAKPPRVVAVHPAVPGQLLAGPPVVGVEIALPESVAGLDECKVEVLANSGGESKSITPVVSGTGLWYIPKAGEFADGLVKVHFTVTDASDRKIEAETSFRVDSSPPEITSRYPGSGAVVTDKHTVIRIGWRDPSGIDPDSIHVVLEPVAAATVRRLLVEKGLQKTGRFSGAHTWKSKSPVVTRADAVEGTIITGTMSALPTGVFRVRVRMRDAMNKLREDAWKFTVR
jgi:tetratricopeptide (TPR) repeat protein